MAPASMAVVRDGAQPQNLTAASAHGINDTDIETAVWPWQEAAAAPNVAAPQPLVATMAPPLAPTPEKKKPNVVILAGALMAGLLVLLIGGFALALQMGSRHPKAEPSPALTQAGAPHKDLPVAGGNTTDTPATSTMTSTTVLAAATSTAEEAADPSSSAKELSTASPLTVTATTTTVAASTSSSSKGAGGSDITTTTALSGGTNLRGAVTCYNFYSQLNSNPLQKYPNNPDSEAFGFATCVLCTNGTATCTSLLHGGRSDLIASHIHLAEGPDADGTKSEGPPVINFCGSNSQGLILDGADYTVPCVQWTDGAAHNKNMPGVLIPNFNRGITATQRMEDIVKRPHMYYFNFHSLASWNHWYPKPHGMARGVMVLQGVAA